MNPQKLPTIENSLVFLAKKKNRLDDGNYTQEDLLNVITISTFMGDSTKFESYLQRWNYDCDSTDIRPLFSLCNHKDTFLRKALNHGFSKYVNAIDKYGENALFYAVNFNHLSAVEILLKYGVERIKNKDGKYADDIAIERGYDEVEFLIQSNII